MPRTNTKGYMQSSLKMQTKRSMSEFVPKSQEINLHKLSELFSPSQVLAVKLQILQHQKLQLQKPLP